MSRSGPIVFARMRAAEAAARDQMHDAAPRTDPAMDAPALRAWRPDDRAAALALLEETFLHTWQPQLSAAAIRRYRRDRVAEGYVDAHGAAFLIAECDGRVAGLLHASAGSVEALHVTRRHRRRGIARRLVLAAEAGMRAQGIALAGLETDTFNLESQALFLALGYREVARYPDRKWNCGLTTIRYEKPLTP